MKKILRAISILLVLGVVTISFLGCRSPNAGEVGDVPPGMDDGRGVM
ncbi:MAG: hypothetical protein II547_05285 [Treponema sp.]|nr:hypothetical protein [Treponema sp.]